MNNSLSRISPVLGGVWLLAFGALAKPDAALQTQPPPKLPYGVADVLKLSQAQVGEDVISTFIQTSGTVYNLAPSDIVYLKGQGVSEHIVNQMLEQRKKLAEASAQPSAAVAPSQPAYTNIAAPAPAPAYVAAAPGYSSAAYVVSDPALAYPYYGYSPYYYGPYYGGYYGYYPFFGFGFGGYGRYGYYGGYRGGYGGYRGGYGGYRGGFGGSQHGGFGGSHSGGHR